MMSIHRNFANRWVIVILVAISTALSLALRDDKFNVLLAGVLALSPLAIIRYPEFDRKDIYVLVFIAFIILSPFLHHPETMRWSTVFYTLGYCLTFMSYTKLIRHGDFEIRQYLTLLKYLIYAYAIVLLIQQCCVLIGLPIFNKSNYDPQTPFKLNSLTSEPAHSARIVGLLMYSFLYVRELVANSALSLTEHFRKDKMVWICFLWTMLTMGSVSAFLFIGLVLLKFFKLKYWLSFLTVTLVAAVVVCFVEPKPIERAYNVFLATLTMNEEAIMQTDGSAAARIVPTVKLLKTVTISDLNGLFGHGIDQLSRDRVIDMSSIGYGKKGVTGGTMTVWYDYGFIVFIMWIFFSFWYCVSKREFLVTFLFWIFVIFLFGINNQIVWLGILLMYTNKYFSFQKQINI